MYPIRHTSSANKNYDLFQASAAFGEALCDNPKYDYDMQRALGVSAVVAQVLSQDIAVREMHHQQIGNPDFDNQDTSDDTITAGLTWLTRADLAEPYGLELGHVINTGQHGRTSPRESQSRLLRTHDRAIEVLNSRVGGSLAVVRRLDLPESVRSAQFSSSKHNIVLGHVKQPVADIHADDARIETHLRTSFGLFRPDGAEIELAVARELLSNYESFGLDDERLLSENVAGSGVDIFPASVTLVGLRRTKQRD